MGNQSEKVSQSFLINDNVVVEQGIYTLSIEIVLLGKGKRFFDSGTIPTALQLLESRSFPSGSVLLRYETAGKPTFRNMESDADFS
ncbi:hypothetical protein [Bacillus sp. FJAT-29814]|uniref:hypothetical protein n=1 Tax=Bacillus sp. FJAT-29814 TaxID=1729688 RepID=UPI00082A8016|nr:hypothetical protein [Bacillus sp. FJAT-29814]